MEQRIGDPPIRRYPRMAAQYAVSYRRVLPGGGEGPAGFSETQTIGLGGLMFESESPMERGENLQVEIALGDHTVHHDGEALTESGRPQHLFGVLRVQGARGFVRHEEVRVGDDGHVANGAFYWAFHSIAARF